MNPVVETITWAELIGAGDLNELFEDMSFQQLMQYTEPRRIARANTVKGPPLRLASGDDSVYWNFNFKSFPSTTGKRHHGYIKFKKPRRGKPLSRLDCVVDCTCPDYKFRWAWANKQRGASIVGNQSMNRAINRAPRITNPSSIPGLCKHIVAMKDYLDGMMSDQWFDDHAVNHGQVPRMMKRLMKYADNRWINSDGDAEDMDREAEVQATVNARNQGALPSGQLPTDAPLRPHGTSNMAPGLDNIDTDPDDQELDQANESTVDKIRMNSIDESITTIKEMEEEVVAAQPAGAPVGGEDEALTLLRSIDSNLSELKAELVPEPEPESEVPELGDEEEELTDPAIDELAPPAIDDDPNQPAV